jgi:hypothetical protein
VRWEGSFCPDLGLPGVSVSLLLEERRGKRGNGNRLGFHKRFQATITISIRYDVSVSMIVSRQPAFPTSFLPFPRLCNDFSVLTILPFPSFFREERLLALCGNHPFAQDVLDEFLCLEALKALVDAALMFHADNLGPFAL